MRRVLLVLTLVAGLTTLSWLPGPAGAGVTVKTGKYSGKTTQPAVTGSFRQIQFTVKKGKVKLTVEPVVAKGLCLSTPVFTLDRSPRKKLNSRGAFTFKKTYVGSKFDTISGRFISPTEVEGFVVYHFNAQDLCGGGKVKVRFTAKRG
jgi:hypothetical protein